MKHHVVQDSIGTLMRLKVEDHAIPARAEPLPILPIQTCLVKGTNSIFAHTRVTTGLFQIRARRQVQTVGLATKCNGTTLTQTRVLVGVFFRQYQ